MSNDVIKSQTENKNLVIIEESPVARVLFGDVRLSWLWLILRLYAGYEWLAAGLEKIRDPNWVGANAGTSMAGFVNGALAKTTGAHAAVQAWYGWFLQNIVLPNVHIWSYLISFGEFIVGVALILGIFTGIAAFFGGFMNVNYLMAGSVSTNPMLFVLATWLVLAWRTAGWIGFDRWILQALGTPWRPGKIFKGENKVLGEKVHA
jgi:thiosulfate dehydrogenase [quinone] large subunit